VGQAARVFVEVALTVIPFGDTTTDCTRSVWGATISLAMFMRLSVAAHPSSRHQECGRTHFLTVSEYDFSDDRMQDSVGLRLPAPLPIRPVLN